MKVQSFCIAFLLFTSSCIGQPQPLDRFNQIESEIQIMLNTNKIGSDTLISLSDEEIFEVEIYYLGRVNVTKEPSLSIFLLTYYTGSQPDSKRARGEIIFYNTENERVGLYRVGSKYDLPSRIDANQFLVFVPDENRCNALTRIDLANGPPGKLFIRCTERGGNLYDFQSLD